MKKFEVGFIGAGNMATAILNGILNSNIILPEKIIISDIDTEKLSVFEKKGVSTTSDNSLLLKSAKYIILAVKPQIAIKILPFLKDSVSDNLFISIMAGIPKNKIKNMLGNVAVTRIMPNTPCMIGDGMCAIDASDFDEKSKILVYKIFKSLGEIVELDENCFDAVTAVSGSGPAYVYMFINSMINGGIECGLSYNDSKKLALQTFKGAVSMVQKTDTPIDILIENVCSKGGTTIQAVDHYRNNNLEQIIIDGMKKCKKRSEELSKE